MTPSRLILVALLLAAAVTAGRAQTPPPPAAYTAISAAGRQTLPVRVVGGQEMVSLDDLARLFDLTVREEVAAGGLTVAHGAQTIVLTPGQPLASVAGRLVSLPAAPVRDGRTWYVPIDFISRALPAIAGQRVDLRKPTRTLVIGDVRMPRVTGRIEPLGAGARLTLDIAPATPHTVRQEGTRIVVRFEADALDALLPATTVAPDVLRAVRVGESPMTIVVETGPRFMSYRATDVPADGANGRLQIDLASPASDTSAAPAAPAAPVPPVLDLPPAGGLRTIVIDAGHGGDDQGVKGPGGVVEKNVTLAVARRLKAALEARLGVRVVMTRDGDRPVALDERAAMGNNNKADLFVSLHASASVRPAMTGASVFSLSLDDYGEAADRAAHETPAPVPVLGGGTRDIEVIPWALAQARHIEQSATLARAVEAALRARVPMSPRPIERGPFRVLVGANMPAVLVEVGHLTNPEQEKTLTTDAYQNLVTAAIVDAVVQFRDGSVLPPGAAAPAGANAR